MLPKWYRNCTGVPVCDSTDLVILYSLLQNTSVELMNINEIN